MTLIAALRAAFDEITACRSATERLRPSELPDSLIKFPGPESNTPALYADSISGDMWVELDGWVHQMRDLRHLRFVIGRLADQVEFVRARRELHR